MSQYEQELKALEPLKLQQEQAVQVVELLYEIMYHLAEKIQSESKNEEKKLSNKVVIYTRVSNIKQVKDGHGLEAQAAPQTCHNT